MRQDTRFIARAAVLCALAYVSALVSVYIPNVSLIYVVVFASGALLGFSGGLAVGGIGMFLWTVFNPYGMAPVPTAISQVVGMMLVGLVGALVSRSPLISRTSSRGFWVFGLLGLMAGILYQLCVSLMQAVLYGPFWPALASNIGFALLTIASNIIIFAVCYPLVVKLVGRMR